MVSSLYAGDLIWLISEPLEWCKQSVILGDLGFLKSELKKDLKQEGYFLWMPLRQNLARAEEHNYWKVMVRRRTIETRFSELYHLFDIVHTLARDLVGLQLRIEQNILSENFSFFKIN